MTDILITFRKLFSCKTFETLYVGRHLVCIPVIFFYRIDLVSVFLCFSIREGNTLHLALSFIFFLVFSSNPDYYFVIRVVSAASR